MAFLTKTRRVLTKWSKIWANSLKEELKGQGHVLTNELHDSIKPSVHDEGFIVEMDEKANFLERFFRQPPFRFAKNLKPRSGSKEGSDYITGLMDFFRAKGVGDEKEVRRRAFVTARHHALHGRPNRAGSSYNFSKNGRRTLFQSHTLGKLVPRMEKEFQVDLGKSINDFLLELGQRSESQING